MKKGTFLSAAFFLATTYVFQANGQGITIGSGAHMASGGLQVSVGAGNFVNNGTYTDTSGTFNMLGGVVVSGTGTTTLNDLNINNTGLTRFNSLVSVNHTFDFIAGDLNANNKLFIRSDRSSLANMIVSGALVGNVEGLVSSPSVSAGPCPSFSPNLSLDVSGPVMVYQWQSSADSATWSDVVGATNDTYTPTVTADGYYRCKLSTTNSSFAEATPGVKLSLTGVPGVVTISGAGPNCGSATLLASGGTGGTIYYEGTTSGGTSTAIATDTALVSSTGVYYFRSRSSAGCWGPQDSANVVINPRLTPVVTLSANPGTHICQGSPTTFTAMPVNGGTAPSYGWYINHTPSGTPAGTGNSFVYTPANGDVVSVVLTSNAPCVTNANTADAVKLTVDPNYSPVVSISALPGLLIGHNDYDTLTANVSNAIPGLSYKWVKNGVAIPGATNATYIGNNFADNDQVTCEVSGPGMCDVASGNSVRISVTNVGVKNLIAGSSIGIIPNPNKGDFSVKGTISAGIGEMTMEITNMLGQVVYRKNITVSNDRIDERVNLGEVANGAYILSLIANGEQAAFHILIAR